MQNSRACNQVLYIYGHVPLDANATSVYCAWRFRLSATLLHLNRIQPPAGKTVVFSQRYYRTFVKSQVIIIMAGYKLRLLIKYLIIAIFGCKNCEFLHIRYEKYVFSPPLTPCVIIFTNNTCAASSAIHLVIICHDI